MTQPKLVQYSGFTSGTTSAASTQKRFPLPNVVLNGNSVVVCLTCGDSETPTVTDDKGNTYTVRNNTDDSGHSQRIFIASSHNITNGPSTILINGTTFALGAGAGGGVLEFAFLDISGTPTDGNSGTFGSSSTPAPGAITTTVDGDLIVACYSRDDAGSPIVSWTSPSGTLVHADIETPFSMQYQIQTTHGAINPGITMDATYGWLCSAVAFKAGATGTLPSALPRVIGVLHQAVNSGGGSGSWTVQTPCSHGGDMLYGSFIGASADALTAITDTSSNSWVATGADLSNGAAVHNRAFYAKNPTLSAGLALTLALGGPGAAPGDTLMFYECIGMDRSAPFAAHGTAVGTQSAGTSFVGASVTPLKANGLVFSAVSVTSNTVTGASPGIFIASTDAGEVSPWVNDENNGWAYIVNPSLSAIQVTWQNDIAVGDWAAIADAFNSATAGSPKLMTMGIG